MTADASRRPVSWSASGVLALLLVACPTLLGAEEDPLERGRRRDPARRALGSHRSKAELPPGHSELVRGLPRVRVLAVTLEGGSSGADGAGDTLHISKDDGFPSTPVFDYEGRLAASAGEAGPGDRLAFRFATQDLGRALPVDIIAVSLGLENAWGRTVWPVVGIALEDPLTPLEPGAGYEAMVSDFDATGLPAPAVPGVADAFARLELELPSAVGVDGGLDVDDGQYSDDFERPSEETLENTGSDWLECSLTECSRPEFERLLLADGSRVHKRDPGDALGIKFPAAEVLALRPVTDLDLALEADYDVSDPEARAAGLFFRLQSLLEFYYVEYRRGGEVALLARTASGPVVLDSASVTPAPSGRLGVRVTGHRPSTRIEVSHDGSTLITYDDSEHLYTGVLSGLVSLGDSRGERWDDFVVRRNRDVFVVVEFPAGEDAALPAEQSVTVSSGAFHSVLATKEGGGWDPVEAGINCEEPANGFVSLVVEDAAASDNLFLAESKLVKLDLVCPACPLDTRSLCRDVEGPLDRVQPVYEVGRSIEITPSWWNEHVPDVDRLMLSVEVYLDDCAGPTSVFLDGAVIVPIQDPGQGGSGPALQATLGPAFSFTPTEAGTHCVQVVEYYDQNLDGCPDGFEAPPGEPCDPCTCEQDPDDNPSTGVFRRGFTVELAGCVPLSVSDLDPGSLRLVKAGSETGLAWRRLVFSPADPERSFNIHLTGSKQELAEPAVRQDPPPWQRVEAHLQEVSVQRELPDLGEAVFVVVFQNDGCAAGWSLADP